MSCTFTSNEAPQVSPGVPYNVNVVVDTEIVLTSLQVGFVAKDQNTLLTVAVALTKDPSDRVYRGTIPATETTKISTSVVNNGSVNLLFDYQGTVGTQTVRKIKRSPVISVVENPFV